MAETHQDQPEIEASKKPTSPVERKRNAPSGRRKLTPHPLNPNNASTAVVEDAKSANVTEVSAKNLCKKVANLN